MLDLQNRNVSCRSFLGLRRTWIVEYKDAPGSGYIAHVAEDGGWFGGASSFGVMPLYQLSFGPTCVIRTAVEALLIAAVTWPERRGFFRIDDRPVDPDWFDWNTGQNNWALAPTLR